MKQGKSQTMNSKHITGHAVDLGAWVNGTVDWDLQHYFKIAEAVRLAAKELKINIIWGGAWGRYLNHYVTANDAYQAYIADRKKAGKKPFIDAVHFELDVL